MLRLCARERALRARFLNVRRGDRPEDGATGLVEPVWTGDDRGGRSRAMYIRFVTEEMDEDAHRPVGVFQVVYRLLKNGELDEAAHDRLREHLDWFRKNLDAPDRVTRTRRPDAPGKAISWFKPTAVEHIRRMRAMCDELFEHGVVVRMIKAERTGFVVFEDEHQVVAEPFVDVGR